jgi:hypothetical protein
MNKAEELKFKSQQALKEKVAEARAKGNETERAVVYFINIFEKKAEHGHFECHTTNIVKMRDGSFYCQTDSGGDGFTIPDIDLFLERLTESGFKVKLANRDVGGYIRLDSSWK